MHLRLHVTAVSAIHARRLDQLVGRLASWIARHHQLETPEQFVWQYRTSWTPCGANRGLICRTAQCSFYGVRVGGLGGGGGVKRGARAACASCHDSVNVNRLSIGYVF